MATNITEESKRAFNARKSGRYDNFACSPAMEGERGAAVSVDEPDGGGETEYGIHPLFVSVTPVMRLTDQDRTEA